MGFPFSSTNRNRPGFGFGALPQARRTSPSKTPAARAASIKQRVSAGKPMTLEAIQSDVTARAERASGLVATKLAQNFEDAVRQYGDGGPIAAELRNAARDQKLTADEVLRLLIALGEAVEENQARCEALAATLGDEGSYSAGALTSIQHEISTLTREIALRGGLAGHDAQKSVTMGETLDKGVFVFGDARVDLIPLIAMVAGIHSARVIQRLSGTDTIVSRYLARQPELLHYQIVDKIHCVPGTPAAGVTTWLASGQVQAGVTHLEFIQYQNVGDVPRRVVIPVKAGDAYALAFQSTAVTFAEFSSIPVEISIASEPKVYQVLMPWNTGFVFSSLAPMALVLNLEWVLQVVFATLGIAVEGTVWATLGALGFPAIPGLMKTESSTVVNQAAAPIAQRLATVMSMSKPTPPGI